MSKIKVKKLNQWQTSINSHLQAHIKLQQELSAREKELEALQIMRSSKTFAQFIKKCQEWIGEDIPKEHMAGLKARYEVEHSPLSKAMRENDN